METILVLAIFAVFIIGLFLFKTKPSHDHQKIIEKNVYRYTPKQSLMSRAETEFYRTLTNIVQDRYVVYPQVHLSALLDHRVKGQSWQYAFRHINGKSVDYVLCDKSTLTPAYAIELDDYTHDTDERKERDSEVQRIFEEANLPLVRFRNYKSLTREEIINALAQAKKLASIGLENQNR